jgi:hypothetical protein
MRILCHRKTTIGPTLDKLRRQFDEKKTGTGHVFEYKIEINSSYPVAGISRHNHTLMFTPCGEETNPTTVGGCNYRTLYFNLPESYDYLVEEEKEAAHLY